MPLHKFAPETFYPAYGLYHNAVGVLAGTSLVFSSSIIGADTAAPEDLVPLMVHLTNRGNLGLSKTACIEALGPHMKSAVPGVIADLFDPALFIEIDVVAARTAERTIS